MHDDRALWVAALRAICAQKRDYFIEVIREKEAGRRAAKDARSVTKQLQKAQKAE